MLEGLKNIKTDETATEADLRYAITVEENIIEQLWSENKELKAENVNLKDEINRLKGEQERPKFEDKKKEKNHSSEKERKKQEQASEKKKKKKKKVAKKNLVKIDKEIKIEVSESDLPSDAKFKGYDDVLQQNVKLVTENILYKVAVYYSKKENRTIRGKMPSDYVGQFGSDLKGLVHVFHHVCDMTQSRIACLLKSMGVQISSGTISKIINSELDWAREEQGEILKAGIAGSDYVQSDSTGNKEKGERRVSHIFSGVFFSAYYTLKTKSRLAVLHALQGGKGELQVQYNNHTASLLERYNISQADKTGLKDLFGNGQVYTLSKFKELVQKQLVSLGEKKEMFRRVQSAFALSYYYSQKETPVVNVLLTDDAPEYKNIALEHHALCWVHDARYYNKLTPLLDNHRKVLEQFKDEYWAFYGLLLDYRNIPLSETKKQSAAKEKIEAEFERIFKKKTNYFPLDKLIEKTYKNKDKLLVVLDVPSLPLHNNAAELAARRIVRKRDISLHTWSEKGTQTRDAFMSIVETAIKLITKRIKKQQVLKPLALMIQEMYSTEITLAK
jgi:hypothetical protein